MKGSWSVKQLDKYAKAEIVFFIVFFFFFPVLTDIEYNLYEQPCQGCDQSFINQVTNRFVFGLFNIPPYVFLYKIVLQRLLLKKKYLAFGAAYFFFLVILNFYIVYCEYWPISKLTFLPANISITATNWFYSKTVMHYSIIYVIQQTLVFTALGYFIHFGREEEKTNALKQAKLEADLNYLKAQIQPHFFFNTLNNIYSLAQQQSVATAPLVAKLSEMMRYVIYETVHQKVPLQKEIEFLKNYVAVESVRYTDNISISFDTQGIERNATVEPLLLLPLIENMFKHGIQNETEKGFIEIVIYITGNDFVLQAKNSKPSARNCEIEGPGIGLNNVKERLKLLYPGKHKLVINENESSYEVVLNIELN